jgi:NADPH:quinone reductase-like Zn-dependent oxidoreductase
MEEKMRAMVSIGDDVALREVDKPTPKPGEVRVKVIASSINPAEEKVIGGEFTGRFLHAKTSPLVVGWDFAGTIDTLGKGITDIDEGTSVWGHLAFSNTQKQGTFAEYITVPRNALAAMPKNVQFHIAGAAPTIAMTSLQSLRDLGNLREGKKVLIIGAGGGIGSISLGIAKRLGGQVTGVCSTKDVERVKALGADEVIDRKNINPLETKSVYDVIFDTPAVYSYGVCAKSLRSNGTYVTTLPNIALMTGMLRALFSSKRCKFVQVSSKQEDLELVGRWLSEGLEVTIDSHYKIANLVEALKRQKDHNRIGRVVVDVADGWPS